MKRVIILLEKAPQVTFSPKHKPCIIRAHYRNLSNKSKYKNNFNWVQEDTRIDKYNTSFHNFRKKV